MQATVEELVPYQELLLGCGARRDKRIASAEPWRGLTTLDINRDHSPDVLWDLREHPLPFAANTFDEIHAYEVLEHLADQGDYEFFFAEFSEYWRILKPRGIFALTCPMRESVWAWADPSHRRLILPQTLHFLSQKSYEEVGKTVMSDFRYIYRADFEIIGTGRYNSDSWVGLLRAIK